MGRPGWFVHPLSSVLHRHTIDEGRGTRDEGAATFDILVDGQRVGEQEVTGSGPERFFDVEYAIPVNMIQGKEKVTVRFQATEGNEIATVFGIRMIRADAKR